ncbi:dynein light intermediate chain [Capsaspora owczarzaki ATCC 30864]|uniref:Dynein light intermediate chain n=1 Tax=Capsaspora owczarzaki (strain ATCC 30864) TaxID=595528 RepID=A0A0D2VPW6_CAPO3|nr:dynein light intermediate chain [Capsaspora owczarzaki ATCC 30864]KJE92562.1 dynein light intermediate chain [Capsaspora owczarzaki ATCC 30864]|eukprot:XP_004348411.1 dynein light intermediate chain [Capsaspora owczarzaki ATCC 30864]
MASTVMAADSASQAQAAPSESLWSSILQSVQTSSAAASRNGALDASSVLVLGPKDAGKSTLLARMRFDAGATTTTTNAAQLVRDGLGLEYAYAEVKDEDNEDFSAQIGVWSLDGDLLQPSTLASALNENNFAGMLAVLAVDLSQPWSILESLKQYTRALEEHIETLVGIEDQLPELKAKLVRAFQTYSEGKAVADGSEAVLAPLEHDVLSRNLGLPIVVVACKSDLLSTLERDYNYKDEHYDFIQHHLRKFCLRYGAALVYTSAKESKNVDLLRKYICHRQFGMAFNQSGSIAEKDAVFVPMGWDSDAKINILLDGVVSINASEIYESVIKKPHARKALQTGDEAVAKDDQAFLQEHAPKLLKLREKFTGSTSSTVTSVSGESKPSIPSVDAGATAGSTASPGKSAAGRSTPADGASNEVIKSFFSSLLNQPKKATAKASSADAPDAAAVPRKDVDAALDQIRNKQP